MTAAKPKPFKVGDWVNITGSHPHRGESGEIVRASNVAMFDWVVAGDDAYSGEWYASERNLRRQT